MQPGDELVLRILRIDSFHQRIALSLKEVSEPEREEWLAQRNEETNAASDAASQNGGEEEAVIGEAEHVMVQNLDGMSPYVLRNQLAESVEQP